MKVCILKFILISWSLHITIGSLAQEKKYIMLDMLDSLYDVNHYSLNTQELYGVDETIELYNIHYVGLVLFSVLPDFTSDKNWSEVNLAEIENQIFDEKSFRHEMGSRIPSGDDNSKKTLQYALVKTQGDKYFKSNYCLTEFFFVDTYPSPFNTPYGTINIGQDILSIQQMMNVYWKALNIPERLPFPLDVRKLGGTLLLPNRRILQREYMSRELKINDERAYQFWTFTDWNTHDGYNLHRGVDRFIYIPDKGIVAGSYDFYFLFEQNWSFIEKGRVRHNKTKEELWQNVLEEKVMLAEELK
ncbi:hypothetical protein [Parapedobacter sp. 10938]|uniref:hypothetical protein n=1 Tax=Parapedobacter flavus TaxID=3110225 RepID=UPI002DB62A30|nr:hypothetical protein [Parapedobacter sp. 10938]MEC3878780.1 hypothetical protein [Parapedobacter sp. 10938]